LNWIVIEGAVEAALAEAKNVFLEEVKG